MKNSDTVTEPETTKLGFPRWWTNGQRWYTARKPDGEVRAFAAVGKDKPTVEETEAKWDAGIPCHPFTKETIGKMVMFEASMHYYGTGKQIGLVVFEFGLPESGVIKREEFDVELFIEDGQVAGAQVRPVSERVQELWEE